LTGDAAVPPAAAWLLLRGSLIAGLGAVGFVGNSAGIVSRFEIGVLAVGFRFRLGIGFFFGGSSYCCWVLIFEIACQISLTPRHWIAENGSGSPASH